MQSVKQHDKILRINSMELCPINTTEEDNKYIQQLDNLLGELKEINEINEHMSSIIASQNENILNAETVVANTVNTVDASNNELSLASQYQDDLFWKKSILITTCTAIVTLPMAVFVGAKTAVICGIGAFGISAYNFIKF
jgi:hypothetical protein